MWTFPSIISLYRPPFPPKSLFWHIFVVYIRSKLFFFLIISSIFVSSQQTLWWKRLEIVFMISKHPKIDSIQRILPRSSA